MPNNTSEAEIERVARALYMARSWLNYHAEGCKSLVPAESEDGPPFLCNCELPGRLDAIDEALAALNLAPSFQANRASVEGGVGVDTTVEGDGSRLPFALKVLREAVMSTDYPVSVWEKETIKNIAAALHYAPAPLSPSTIEQAREDALAEAAKVAVNHSNYGHVEGNKRAFRIAHDLETRAKEARALGKGADNGQQV